MRHLADFSEVQLCVVFIRFFESLMAVCLRMCVAVFVLLGSLMFQRAQHAIGDGECAIAHSGPKTKNLI